MTNGVTMFLLSVVVYSGIKYFFTFTVSEGAMSASVSDPLEKLVVRGDSLPVELCAKHQRSEQLRVLAHLATRSRRVDPQLTLGLQSVNIRQT